MKLYFFFLLLIGFTSCSEYNHVLKGDDYKQKFELANTLFDNRKFERCVTLFEQVYQRSPRTPEGEVSFYRLGKACYAVEDWYLASYYLSAFQNKFPFSPKIEETTFLTALCAVQNSPEASLDQNETEMAINELQNFVNRFPSSDRIDTCNLIMKQMRSKLETKDILNVRLYSKTENFRAAAVSSEQFLNSYPSSSFREECYAILVKNSYKLALNSVDEKKEERKLKCLENLSEFIVLYPNSSYLRDFETYQNVLEKL